MQLIYEESGRNPWETSRTEMGDRFKSQKYLWYLKKTHGEYRIKLLRAQQEAYCDNDENKALFIAETIRNLVKN